jgi:hypothetical protein
MPPPKVTIQHGFDALNSIEPCKLPFPTVQKLQFAIGMVAIDPNNDLNQFFSVRFGKYTLRRGVKVP